MSFCPRNYGGATQRQVSIAGLRVGSESALSCELSSVGFPLSCAAPEDAKIWHCTMWFESLLLKWHPEILQVLPVFAASKYCKVDVVLPRGCKGSKTRYLPKDSTGINKSLLEAFDLGDSFAMIPPSSPIVIVFSASGQEGFDERRRNIGLPLARKRFTTMIVEVRIGMRVVTSRYN